MHVLIVLNEFLTADHSCTIKYLKKTLIKVGISHICASFGTFCVQIGQLFEAQRDFKHLEEFEIDNKNSDLTIFKHFSKTHVRME